MTDYATLDFKPDLSPQSWILSAMVGGELQQLISHGILPSKLSSPYREVWLWATQYIADYGSLPLYARTCQEFPDVVIPPWDQRPVEDVLDRFYEDLGLRMVRAAVIEIGRTIEAGGDHMQRWQEWNELITATTAQIQIASWKEAAIERIEEYQNAILERLKGNEPGTGVLTGIRVVDEVTHGLLPAELAYYLGRYDVGKTTLLAHSILAAAKTSNLALVLSPEHSIGSMMRKLDCLFMELDPVQLRMGNFNKDMIQRLEAEKSKMGKVSGDIKVITSDEFSIEILASLISVVHPQIVYVDGLSFLSPYNSKDPDWLALGKVGQRLKALARRFQIPIVSVIQQSKDTGLKAGAKDKIARSDMLGRGADLILSVDAVTDDIIKVEVIKYRETGSRGKALYLKKGTTGLSFTETDNPENVTGISGWSDF